ncbi:MAG: hypothetical protein DSY75_08685 [Alteromonas sp.]|nr:MAG: hypothetical protein DSY75_08685 [Alteromonas sp.]
MKRSVVAFLGKDNMEIEDLQSTSSDFKSFYHPNFDDKTMVLCISKNQGKADWSTLFSDYSVEQKEFSQHSVKAALFVKIGLRYVIFTFGHGRGLINKSSIERGFGLKVSMNLGDPGQLKSVDKSTLERVARNTRSQVSINSGIEDFDFEFDHEILKSMTAIVVRDDDELEMISGKDSVSLYTDIDFDKFEEIASRLIDAYESNLYKEKYPWAEFIKIEVDPSITSELEELLVRSINNRDLDNFWLAPPSIINYEDFSGFVYSTKNPPCKHPELDLYSFLSEAPFKQRNNISIAALKKKVIKIYNGDDKKIDEFPVFDALNGEAEYKGNKYVLNDGLWYQISNTFAEEVEKFFIELPIWKGLENKPYQDKRECCYLRRIADGEEIAVLDQHWVRHKEVKQNYEFCDLLTQCGRIIHVKHYGGSSVLSHLFSQATNGVEMLLNCPEIIPQIQEYLEETYLSFDFDPKKERKNRVVLAIIQEKQGDLHIPFLSKVNLRHHARGMMNRGFTVELAKIPVDSILAAKALDEQKCICKSKTAIATRDVG